MPNVLLRPPASMPTRRPRRSTSALALLATFATPAVAQTPTARPSPAAAVAAPAGSFEDPRIHEIVAAVSPARMERDVLKKAIGIFAEVPR